MMPELYLLYGLLSISFVLAPCMTRQVFWRHSVVYGRAHAGALALAMLAMIAELPGLSGAWLVFCLYGAGLFFKRTFLDAPRSSLSLPELAQGIPIAFSVISAGWFVGGMNDLRLLGYGTAFSYYAALHGAVLGWMYGSSLAALIRWRVRLFGVYLGCLLLIFASFLLIAYGIDGTPIIKPLGVAGLTVALLVSQVLFIMMAYGVSKPAFWLGLLSLGCVLFTMTLAWQNEVGALPVQQVAGVRSMVVLHGILNAVVAVPAFMGAVLHFGRGIKTNGDGERFRFDAHKD